MDVSHHLGWNKLPRRVPRSFPGVPKRRVHHDAPTTPKLSLPQVISPLLPHRKRYLALLRQDNQPDAAKEAGSRAIVPVPERRPISGLPTSSCSWRDTPFQGKAICHFEAALGTVLLYFCWDVPLTRVHRSLSHRLFFDEDGLDNPHGHAKRAKSRADNVMYYLARAMELQAGLWIEDVGLRRQNAL